MCDDVATKDDVYIKGERMRVLFFASEYNVHFFDPKAEEWCHGQRFHGPNVPEKLRAQRAEKNDLQSNFYNDEALWAARHIVCAMFKEEMDRRVKEGIFDLDAIVKCPEIFENGFGSTLFSDGKTVEQCSTIFARFEFRDGVWYERTIYAQR